MMIEIMAETIFTAVVIITAVLAFDKAYHK